MGSTTRFWRLSRFWISDTAVEGQFQTELIGYWATNPGTADITTVWDAFKATIRGPYRTIIARVHREHRVELTRAERDAASGEELFIRTWDPQHYAHLQLLTREVLDLRTSLTQKKLLAQSQRIFEQGERPGRLLAWLSREQMRGMSVPHIMGPRGELWKKAINAL